MFKDSVSTCLLAFILIMITAAFVVDALEGSPGKNTVHPEHIPFVLQQQLSTCEEKITIEQVCTATFVITVEPRWAPKGDLDE